MNLNREQSEMIFGLENPIIRMDNQLNFGLDEEEKGAYYCCSVGQFYLPYNEEEAGDELPSWDEIFVKLVDSYEKDTFSLLNTLKEFDKIHKDVEFLKENWYKTLKETRDLSQIQK